MEGVTYATFSHDVVVDKRHAIVAGWKAWIFVFFLLHSKQNQTNMTTVHCERASEARQERDDRTNNLRALRDEPHRFISPRRPTTIKSVELLFQLLFSISLCQYLLIEIADRSFRLGFHVLNQRLVQVVEVTVAFVDRPLERAVLGGHTVSTQRHVSVRE